MLKLSLKRSFNQYCAMVKEEEQVLLTNIQKKSIATIQQLTVYTM